MMSFFQFRLRMKSSILFAAMSLLGLSIFTGQTYAQRIPFSDFITGNIDLPDGQYDRLRIQGYGQEDHFILLDDIVFTNATVNDGRLTHAEGSEPFNAYGLELLYPGGEITIKEGKVYLTVKFQFPQIFALASDSDPSKPGAGSYQPVEEHLTVYFDGENVGFSDIRLQLPDLVLEGLGSLTGVIFQLATDPAFYLHVGGGIHLAQLAGIPGLDDDSSPGIDTELEIGKLQEGGMAYTGLKKFRIAATGLDQNIDGMDIVFLQSIDVSIGDIMIDVQELERLGSMYLEGSLTMTVLPAVEGLAIVEVTAGGKIKPWPIYISIFSSSKFFGFFNLSNCTITYQYPNRFSYSVTDYLIPGVFKIEGTLSAGSWRTQYVVSQCPMTPYSAYDNLDAFQVQDDCVRGALDNWQAANFGFVQNDDNSNNDEKAAREWDTLFHGEISAYITIPDFVPIIGGKDLAGIGGRVTQDYIYARADFLLWFASALIRFHESDIEWDGGWKNMAQPANSWETPYNQPFVLERPSEPMVSLARWQRKRAANLMSVEENKRVAVLSFMDNWTRVDASTTGSGVKPFRVSPAGEPVTALQVPEGAPAVIFRLNYENETLENLDMTLTLPGGAVLNFADGFLPNGFSEVFGYSAFNPAAREGFFTLDSPAGGEYIVTVGNEAQLGNFTVEALIMGQPAEIQFISAEPAGQPNQYIVTWECFDPDNSASVFVYLDADRSEGGGYLIGCYAEDGEINTHTFDTSSLSIPAGEYYVAVGISDGQYGMVWDYSEQRIFISDPEAPEPVQGIAVASGDGQFTIEWEPSDDPDVAGYAVRWTENNDIGLFEGEHSVYGRENHTLVIDDLKNGVPYLVTVVAISEDMKFSYPETVLRIVPHKEDGSTPPVLLSKPCPYARIGELYVYMPKFSDSSRHYQEEIDIQWRFIQGPAGMSVRKSDGFIQWTPTAYQEGVNPVAMERDIYIGSVLVDTIDESFEIKARYAHDLQKSGNTANHILSSPQLSAVEDTLYQHKIGIFDRNGNPVFELLEGPAGMVCSNTGLLSWQVPENAKGGPVRVLVTYADGEKEDYDFFIDVISPSNTLEGSSMRHFNNLK